MMTINTSVKVVSEVSEAVVKVALRTMRALVKATILVNIESPIASTVCVGIALITWQYRHKIGAYVEIGPYAPADERSLFRIVNRILIDRSKRNVTAKLYPLDSLASYRPNRSNDNGHATAGAVRDAAVVLINQVLLTEGRPRVEISPPAGGQTPETPEGSQIVVHYATGDLSRDVSLGEVKAGDIVVCVDTDYYIEDVDKYLSKCASMVMFTFNPLKVSGLDGDCNYRIVDNQVDYCVGNGGRWKHKVWDWCGYGEHIRSPVVDWNWKTILLGMFGVRKYVLTKVLHARPWA
jgi:hypothetical protein